MLIKCQSSANQGYLVFNKLRQTNSIRSSLLISMVNLSIGGDMSSHNETQVNVVKA